MYNKFKKNSKNKKRGIALFIAVITVSALLLISLAISDIAYKEQIISASGRDSRIAFFAANSGLECALFNDLKGGNTGTFLFSLDGSPTPDFTCGGVSTNPDTSVDGAGVVTTTFYFNVSMSPAACTVVRVSKATTGGGLKTKTEIVASGYNNICGAFGAVQSGPRNLERSLKVTY